MKYSKHNALINELHSKSLIDDHQYHVLASDSSVLREQPDWTDVRKMFFGPDTDSFQVEPMNAANLCPTFYHTIDAIHRYRQMFNQDISMQRRQALFATVIKYTKQTIARQFGGIDVNDLALVRNTSEGNNQLSRGYSWSGEDNEVLLWDENHPTNLRTWRLRRPSEKCVSTFTLKDLDLNGSDEDVEKAIVSRITGNLTLNTRFLSFTEVSNISGIKMPTAAIITAVREYERSEFGRLQSWIHIHVDGAMSWGAIHHDLRRLDCDSFTSSAHKWLMGPFETGIFYIKKEKATNFEMSIFAYDGKIDIPEIPNIPKDATRFELLGQRDDANLYALYSTLLIHDQINVDQNVQPQPKRIQVRILQLQNYLRTKLSGLSARYTVSYLTPRSSKFSNGVTIFQISYDGKILDHSRLYAYLYESSTRKKRFAVARTSSNHLRICPHIMNLPKNIDDAIEEIKTFAEVGQHLESASPLLHSTCVDWAENPYAVNSTDKVKEEVEMHL